MSALVRTFTTPEETTAFAKAMAPFLVAGDVVLLKGNLGAGKSHFVRALIKALGSRQEHIPSPTFTLIQNYDDTRLPVAHVDLYRLNDASEVHELHLDSFMTHGILLVEWPERVPDLFPSRVLLVTIEDMGGDTRKFTFDGDAAWQRRLAFFAPELRRPVSDKSREAYVQSLTGKKGAVITPVSADASFRSYWRVRMEDGMRVLMDAPPPLEDIKKFVLVDEHLEKIGVHVPHIYEVDEEQGYAILEDLGDTTFYAAIQNGADTRKLYEKAVDVLIHMARNELAPVGKYTTQMYQDEACLYTDWYMPTVNEHATHTATRRAYRELWLPLVDKINQTPKTTVHFDYHCQNLMLIGAKAGEKAVSPGIADVGVLDFQDARIGSVAHDMASLLYDVRFDVPLELHDGLMRRLVEGLDGACTMETFTTAVKISGVQNLSRIAGVFTRLAFRDGKKNYLRYMPRLWRHFDSLVIHPDMKELKKFYEKHTPVNRELSA